LPPPEVVLPLLSPPLGLVVPPSLELASPPRSVGMLVAGESTTVVQSDAAQTIGSGVNPSGSATSSGVGLVLGTVSRSRSRSRSRVCVGFGRA